MARLTLTLLGGLAASVDGVPVTRFDADKTRALLAYLAAEAARPHAREAVAGLLWPELPEEASRRNLRHSLFKLRQILDEGAASPASQGFLLVTPQTVQIDPAADCSLDVVEFTALIAASRGHRHRKVEYCTSCHSRLQSAAELYRGDFLKGFHLADSQEFEEWLVLKREALHREALDVFDHLATYHETHGEYEQALRYAHRELELEPWREEAHRTVMRLLALTHRRSEALAQYVACRRALAQELDADPSEETNALYDWIKAGREEPEDSIVARHNLPRQLSPFIGREEELARIIEQLGSPDYGLIVIVGPGGVGKTRLALQAAAQQIGAFDDGVYWIPLASAASLEQVATSIAQATGLHLHGDEDPAAQLLNYLRDKEMLLLLDNFEQLLGTGDAAYLVGSILERSPRTCVLVTSRERLGLQGELLLDLSGLPFPAGGSYAEPADYGAVQLFVERARQVRPDFALDGDTTVDAVEICRLVEGLPLGIVLAAPWVRYFSLDRITASIRANLDFLQNSTRRDRSQHSSLRAVFDHSWNLLPEEEKQVFRRLSVFRGGWEEEAAEMVAGASLHTLLSLVDKSLLRQNAGGRFGMHEMLRQYAAEKLDEVPAEREEAGRLHAGYYMDLAEQAWAGLGGEDDGRWLEQLELEYNNLRAAMRWADEGNHVDIGLRFAGALSRFWFIRGYVAEGSATIGAALRNAGYVADQDVRHLAPRTAYLARALRAAGDMARAQGDYDRTRAFCEQSLFITRELGDRKEIATSLARLAIAVWSQGDRNLARSLYEESAPIWRELGDDKAMSGAFSNLGLMAAEEGDYATARSLLEEAISLNRAHGSKHSLAIQLSNLGNVALLQRDYAGARALHAEGLALRRELGDKWGVAVCLVGLGCVAAEEGNAELGAKVLGAVHVLLDALGVSLEPDDLVPYERGIASARAQLGEEAFARAWSEGMAMPLEDAINSATQGSIQQSG